MQEPLTYDFAGPALAPQRLAELEQQLGAPLPEDYRQFLLQSNGGIPSRKSFLVGPDVERDIRWVDDFVIIDDRFAPR